MPRPCPHLALFSLTPVRGNERAERAVAHPSNSHLVSTLRNGALGLDIGFHIRSKSCNTLATLGRGETDIFVEGSSIAKVQFSFEIDFESNFVVLYDRSHGQTTQVSGGNAMPFEHVRIRKVVMQKDLNNIIGMGGQGQNLIQFRIMWHSDPAQTTEKLKNQESILRCYENPRLARTVDDTGTVLPSRRETRTHTPGHLLGSGAYGTVYKAINVDSGKLMAVKILEQPLRASKLEDWKMSLHYAINREVETLSEISHPHIVNYIASQGWGEPKLEIFMGLEEGTLGSIVKSGVDASAIAESVFHQMLQALDCLAWKGIVNRDVKPENILFVSQPGGQYQFQLGDFGLCNRVVEAVAFAGTHLYMAPEMFFKGGQASKLDVWSFFVTILWTLNFGGFSQMSNRFKSIGDVQEAVLLGASSQDSISKIREMAIVKVEERASAAQMLVKCYDGVGLSTPRNQISALIYSPSPAIAVANAPGPAPPASNARTKSRGLRKQAKTSSVGVQYRIKKLRNSPPAQKFRRVQELRPKPPANS
ncbi:MAG: hypothetical protein M1829_003862 [Trizodia sp. TS-e1964]|nr:MAG: hypothetical protein M1829_003862 [Trizodia sp. TS-e1964]